MAEVGLIALDIDGTLLDDAGRCSAYTLETLDKARGAGAYICAVTARPRRHTRALPFDFDGIACLAGAMVCVGETVVAREVFDMREAQNLYAAFIARYPSATVSVESCDTFFGNFEDEICEQRDILRQPEQPVDKMYFSLPDGGAGDYLRSLLPGALSGALYGAFMLVMRAGVDKLYGVRALCGHFGVSRARALALGNDTDDLPMINGTGYGAAMLNAPESVKGNAQRITAFGNNDDGAARYIADIMGL